MGEEDVRASFRLGIVGLGPWSERYFSTCSGIPGVEIVAASRRSSSPPSGFASGIPVFRDWSDVLDVGVDGLIVAAHPSVHPDILSLCAKSGIPVMLEKPMALSSDSARRMSELSFSAPVLVNHVHLFSPAFEKIRHVVAQRSRDPIRIISCGAGMGPFRDYSSLWDYGPHDVSMCLALMGFGLPAVSSDLIASGGGTAHRVHISSGELEADVTVSNTSPEKIRVLRVEFDGHVAVYDDRSSVKLRLDGDPVPVEPTPPLTVAIRAFLDSIVHGSDDWRFGTDVGLNVCHVLELADKRPPD